MIKSSFEAPKHFHIPSFGPLRVEGHRNDAKMTLILAPLLLMFLQSEWFLSYFIHTRYGIPNYARYKSHYDSNWSTYMPSRSARQVERFVTSCCCTKLNNATQQGKLQYKGFPVFPLKDVICVCACPALMKPSKLRKGISPWEPFFVDKQQGCRPWAIHNGLENQHIGLGRG